MQSLRLLKYVIPLFLIVLLAGMIGYSLIENVPLFDAFYMTVITITTVGFGEVFRLSTAGRMFTIFIIVAGFCVIMLFVGVLTQVAVEIFVHQVMERRRLQKEIGKMSRHYIVCGCGRIGNYVLTELRKIHVPYVIIERDAHLAEELFREGIPCILGEATDEEILTQANLPAARGLVVTVSSDAEAVFIILTARGINPDLFIVARAIEEKNETKLRQAGANRVMSPYRLIGKRLANSILRPAVTDMIDTVMFSDELELALEGVEVFSGSPLTGQTLRRSGIREKFGLIIIGIRKPRGHIMFNPGPGEVIEPGDSLITIGARDALAKLTDYLSATGK